MNRGVFYAANALVLLIIICMLFRIRHVADETLIKRECAMLVMVWIFFSVWVFGAFVSDGLSNCIGGWSYTQAVRFTYYISYWTLMIRNLLILSITLYYQCKVSHMNLYYSRLLDSDNRDTTKVALADFEMLLISGLPYKAFSRFLTTERPEMIPYLKMIQLCKFY